MNPARLLAHFDRLSEAPDAIPRLRKFILDLAVRGKLVPQDPKDEPASVLLKRIQAKREKLIKSGEIRQGKPYEPVQQDETAFVLPKGWIWVRIRQVTCEHGQTTPSHDFTYIDVTAIDKENGIIADSKILSASDAPSRARKMVQKGDVIYSCVRPYLLNIAILETDIVPAPIASTAFAVLDGLGLVLAKYLWIALRSPFMVSNVEAKMRGQAYPAINDADFSILPLPLPPLAEQHRIVAKVDELMALCDQLEAARKEREDRRDRLVAASLHRINNPTACGTAAPGCEKTYARFHLENLFRLTTRPKHIQHLRQTILNLAVCGKLVPQESVKGESNGQSDPRRTALIQATKGPDLPEGWSLQPLANIATEIVDCPHSTPKWTADGKICVRTSQLRPGELDLSESRFVNEETFSERIQRLRPQEDDILYSREGGILGVACRVPRNVELCLGQRMMLIRSGDLMEPAFLELVLNSPLITAIARHETTGGAAPRVNVATIKQYHIPSPSLAEQHRIVAKVDELMVLCDRLEASLTTTQAESRRLLDSTLNEAIGMEK